MSVLRLTVALLCSIAVSRCATASVTTGKGAMELALVRPPSANEAVGLELHVGPLPPGARLRVVGGSGEVLGAVTPYGVSRAAEGGSYTVMVPDTAIVDGRVRFRLIIEAPNAAPRAPGLAEVEKVTLIYVPVNPR